LPASWTSVKIVNILLISKEKLFRGSCCLKWDIAAQNVNFACDDASFRYTSLRISSVRVRGFTMFKLAVAAVVAALFAFSPVQAAGAGAGAGAGATEQAKKSSVTKKKVQRKVVRKARVKAKSKRAKRQDLAAVSDNRGGMVRRVKMVRGKRVVTYQPIRTAAAVGAVAIAAKTAGDMAGLDDTNDPLSLRSNVAYVVDQNSAEVLFEKNANVALPIASLTKLMTGMIVMDSKQDLDEVLRVTDADVDRHKFSSSRLPVGANMTRRELLHIALMSSENRAAAALGRNYPGGIDASSLR
jgi:D-alanyl-D-alanine endopeptidase (penicillin-binding protein 7)